MSGRAFRYILPYWRRLTIVFLVCLVSTAVSLWLPYLTKPLVDEALIGRNGQALRQIVVLFVAAGALGFLLNVVSGLRYTRVSAEILFDMRRELYEHLQRLSPRFYASTHLGDIVSRINSDVGEIQRIAAETALAWVGNVLFLIGGVAILVWLDWRLFLIGAATLPLSVWALRRYRRQLEPQVADLRQRSADIGSFLIETLRGMRAVVTSNAQEREVARFSRLNDAFIGTLMGVQRAHYVTGALPGLIVSAGTAAVFLYGGLRVVDGSMTLGTLAAFLAYQARVVGPVQALMGLYGALASARVSWHRVATLLDTPLDVNERADAQRLSEVRGRIAFEDVWLSHGRGGAVLEGVSFGVDPGQVLAIVGASGSGKSTIADLLVRLLDPDSGVVRLDGHDLAAIALNDLRRHVQVVDQDPVLFHTSIADNVRYANPSASESGSARRARRRRHRVVRRNATRRPADDRRRSWTRAVGGRTSAARARAGVSRQSVSSGTRRTNGRARSRVGATGDRRLSTGHARPNDGPDLAQARSHPIGGPRHRARGRPRGRERTAIAPRAPLGRVRKAFPRAPT